MEMASKYFLLFLLLLVFVQTPSTFQLQIPSNYSYLGYISDPFPRIKTKEIKIKEIVKAVDDGGFKIMSLILQNQFSRILSLYRRWKWKFGLVTKSKAGWIATWDFVVTVFIPSDKSFIDYEDRKMLSFLIHQDYPKVLESQFVHDKVDKEAFESGFIRKGRKLTAVNGHILHVSGFGSINNVTITHWDIYNDGCIIVHVVEDFFTYSPDYEYTCDEL